MVLERSTHLTHKEYPLFYVMWSTMPQKFQCFFFNAYVLLDETHVILLSQSCTENEA